MYDLIDVLKKNGMGRNVARVEDRRDADGVLVGRPEGKSLLGSP